jgi:hypothetical protein
MRLVSVMMMGAILGAALVQSRLWHEQVQLMTQTRQARLDAQHWRQESLRLRDQLSAINRRNERQTYVQTITLEVIKSPVPLIDVQAALEPFTQSLLGIPLATVKLELIYQLLQNRRIVVGDNLYRVDVKALLWSPDVTILLQLTPLAAHHHT